MGKEEKITIRDIDVAIAVIAHETTECISGSEEQETTQPRKLVSCTGGTFCGLRSESWPTTEGGDPLVPWLQLVCTEITSLYGAFHNLQSVCFYIRHDFDDYEAFSETDAADFVVREYSLNDELVPLVRPPRLQGHPFHQVVWKKQPDYPAISKYYGLFDRDVYDSLCKMKRLGYENLAGIKIGGWPTPIQRGQDYPGSCDLQIDVTENYMYGDSGIGYLTRTNRGWHVLFECC